MRHCNLGAWGNLMIDKRSPYLTSLTGMRFGAALLVFAYHVGGLAFAPVLGQGRVGVSFFFVLSGLVLSWGWKPTDGALNFYRRRLARIYPVYLIALLLGAALTIVITGSAQSIFGGIASVFLLQAWIPAADAHFAWNIVSWSLSVEAFFYSVFPVLAPLVLLMGKRRRRVLQAGMLVIIVALGIFATIMLPDNGQLPDTVASWLVYTFPLARLPEFVLGMTLAAEIRDERIMIPRRVATGFLLAAYLLAGLDSTGVGLVAVTILPLCLFIVSYAKGDTAGHPSVFTQKWLLTLGASSYCFYLVHHLVLRAALWLWGDGGAAAIGISAVAALAVSLVAGEALHRHIEKPLDTRFNGRTRRSVPTRS